MAIRTLHIQTIEEDINGNQTIEMASTQADIPGQGVILRSTFSPSVTTSEKNQKFRQLARLAWRVTEPGTFTDP
jgi:hypothetical protein